MLAGMSDDLQTLDLPCGVWTPIATRPRDRLSRLSWSQLPDAPIDLGTAYRMHRAGDIVMASRHRAAHIDLVVRPSGT